VLKSGIVIRLLVVAGLAGAVLPPALGAQERRPQGWSLSLEGGTQLPTTIYHEWIRLSLPPIHRPGEEPINAVEVTTRWTEEVALMPVVRFTAWYRPDAPFHFFTTFQHSGGPSTGTYHGGRDPVETVQRSVRISMLEGGVGVRLFRWADGRGTLGYVMGPVWAYHVIDLSGGHRRAFLRVDPEAPPPPESPAWSPRSWSTWGLSLGGALRHPVTERLLLRLSGHMHVLPNQGVGVAEQERRDIDRLSTGRTPAVYVPPYASSQFAVRIGVEYLLSWLRTPWEGLYAAPLALEPPPPPTTEVLSAVRDAAAGDTAAALAALRERVAEQPADGSARRQLALLLAAQAGERPALRAEAWHELRRALALYPGDEQLLAALGRVRGAMDRAAQETPAPPALHVSEVVALGDAAGALTVLVSARGGAESSGRFNVLVQVTGPRGRAVPVRAEGVAIEALEQLELADVVAQEGLIRLQLRLERAEAGPHTVRVRVTDPATGLRAEASGGFELR
jgi:hypothetical protein